MLWAKCDIRVSWIVLYIRTRHQLFKCGLTLLCGFGLNPPGTRWASGGRLQRVEPLARAQGRSRALAAHSQGAPRLRARRAEVQRERPRADLPRQWVVRLVGLELGWLLPHLPTGGVAPSLCLRPGPQESSYLRHHRWPTFACFLEYFPRCWKRWGLGNLVDPLLKLDPVTSQLSCRIQG